ncbi:unnamed protein product [Peronospora destructor]|uniref:Uncharacterized protein n=1 Tax=Peronospora destructor TaxID=86335 RepID=A0AAV0T5H3_9STRA|nr:unnamed protein product [Peronospora destructor]
MSRNFYKLRLNTQKQRGRNQIVTAKTCKTKDTNVKARLRNYERRSRHKRKHRMLTRKKTVAVLETHLENLCQGQQNDTNSLKYMISELTMEATSLANHNYHLRKVLDDHHFFHLTLQLEYDNRETTTDSVVAEFFDLQTPYSWCPMEETICLRIMRDSFLEIVAFSNNDDFISSGLADLFAKDCSEDLATRSWEMRAVQDQVTRYFGHSLAVKVEVLQRFKNDVVVVRRKIKHTVDGWVHHTIYLLFRTKTPDGHLVCIRDMNPNDTDDLHLMSGSATQCVIWSKVFTWWKFTKLPQAEGQQIGGFEVEYGGSLGSATQTDAAFWLREVLVLALRWENLVVGPLITLG